MKVSILLLSFLVFSTVSFAQDTLQKRSPHYIGTHAGSVSGIGFSYRYWPKKLGFQLTAIPIFQSNKRNFISAGVSALYLLKEGKHIDLYSYLGFHFMNQKSVGFTTDTLGNYVNAVSIEQHINYGVGLGVKINLLKVLDLSLQLGAGFYRTNQTHPYLNINPDYFFYGAGGIGIYYHI